MDRLTLGVVATSRKPDEHRLAIHPRHVDRIDPELRRRIVLEEGYGARFGVPDAALAPLVAGLRPREELLAESDVVLLPKPLAEDLEVLRPGQVVWGWPHCVQDRRMTQAAIDRRLTLVAWEAMNLWHANGAFDLHVFHKNNELAGYCSVLHALQLVGQTGHYGRRLRAVVISFGATARGAVRGLLALGITDVTVLTHRDVTAVAAPFALATLEHFERNPADPDRVDVLVDDRPRPMAEALAEYDVVVNCVLQDTDRPLVFVTTDDLERFAAGTLFIDVSCDEGMGFSWARPTSFSDPMRTVGAHHHYYAVDHTPSLLYDASTWEISEALLGYLPTVLAGPDAWDGDETIRRSIEIRDGTIQNPRILSFQDREPDYPHRSRRA